MNRLLAVRKALCAGLSLAGLMTSVSSASAAWNNVFQVTCWNCQTRTNTSYYSPPVAAPPVTLIPVPVVGFGAVENTTPRSVTAAPPSLVTNFT